MQFPEQANPTRPKVDQWSPVARGKGEWGMSFHEDHSLLLTRLLLLTYHF